MLQTAEIQKLQEQLQEANRNEQNSLTELENVTLRLNEFENKSRQDTNAIHHLEAENLKQQQDITRLKAEVESQQEYEEMLATLASKLNVRKRQQ